MDDAGRMLVHAHMHRARACVCVRERERERGIQYYDYIITVFEVLMNTFVLIL